MLERISKGIFPGGVAYADRQREKNGDLAKLAFLSFATLELKIYDDCPDDLRRCIEANARSIQARRGEVYRVSANGQVVRLGHAKKWF